MRGCVRNGEGVRFEHASAREELHERERFDFIIVNFSGRIREKRVSE